MGPTPGKTVCNSFLYTATAFLQLEGRPRGRGNRRVYSELGDDIGLCTSSLVSHVKSSEESPDGGSINRTNNSSQPWFPMITSMLVDQPILLPNLPNLITPSLNCDYPVSNTQPQFVARKISGNASDQERFRSVSLASLCPHGEAKQMLTITLLGRHGRCGASRKVSIPFQRIFSIS